MARNTHQSRLNQLEEDALYFSRLAAEQVRYTLDALGDKDERKTQEVIENGHGVNRIYLDLEQDCIDLLALQQPIADSLRFIAASFKIITDLERIGDLATDLARYAIDAENDAFAEIGIRHIGDATLDMVDRAVDAYESGDTDLYHSMAEYDNDLDATCNTASQSIVHDLMSGDNFKGDGDLGPETALVDARRLLLTVRDLERVSDHTVNVTTQTLYMVDSDDSLLF